MDLVSKNQHLDTHIKPVPTERQPSAIFLQTSIRSLLILESYDVNENFDSTTNYRYTAPVAGYYLVCASIRFETWVDQTRVGACVYKNGSIWNLTTSSKLWVEQQTALRLTTLFILLLPTIWNFTTTTTLGQPQST